MPHLGPQRYVPGQSRPYPPPQSGSPVPPHWWWFVVPLATFGFGTFAMVWIAGTRLATRRTTMAAAGYAASAFLIFLLIIVGSPDGVLGGLTALLLLMLWFGGTAHVAVLQTRVRQLDAGTPAPPVVTHADDPGIAAAQWRQQRRREARELLLTNPGMAAELRIGRPDVPDRSYQDGGLVDVNHVPAEWLRNELDLTSEQVAELIQVREERRGLHGLDDILTYCKTLSPQRLMLIEDRLVYLPW